MNKRLLWIGELAVTVILFLVANGLVSTTMLAISMSQGEHFPIAWGHFLTTHWKPLSSWDANLPPKLLMFATPVAAWLVVSRKPIWLSAALLAVPSIAIFAAGEAKYALGPNQSVDAAMLFLSWNALRIILIDLLTIIASGQVIGGLRSNLARRLHETTAGF